MITIGVIILNYLAYKTTINAVYSFLAQRSDGYDVKYVIVDNDSPNESYKMLCQEFKNNNDVFIIKSEKNLGFANGNNLGYNELIKHFDMDFVVVSNEDILLPNLGLFDWIKGAYDKYGYAVLGPDIYSLNGDYHQSPTENRPRDIHELKKQILDLKKKKVKCYIKKWLRVSDYSCAKHCVDCNYKKINDKLTLHGAFQVFSKDYFEHYEEPYDPSTFLYVEEDILKLRCDLKNLKMVYDPSYRIEHFQAVSTSMIPSELYKKELYRYNCLIDSLEKYMGLVRHASSARKKSDAYVKK